MEHIIGDKYLVDAKEFIQKHVQDKCLTAEVKNKFIEYYNSINQENAKFIYDEISRLYHEDVLRSHLDFNMSMVKISGCILLVGAVLAGLGYAGQRYIRVNTTMHSISYTSSIIGIGTIIIGTAMLFSTIGIGTIIICTAMLFPTGHYI